MSQTTANITNNQAQVNTDTAKIFVWNNRFTEAAINYENSTYDDITWPAGTVMGRIASTNKVVPLTSAASDGSQFPVGILAQDVTIEAGDTLAQNVTICVEGDVNENLIDLQGSDTLATVISARTIRDRIGADTVGIKLVATTEMTSFDNS